MYTHTDIHRHTDTQTHRHTDADTQTQTHRHTDTDTDTQTHRHTHKPFFVSNLGYERTRLEGQVSQSDYSGIVGFQGSWGNCRQ